MVVDEPSRICRYSYSILVVGGRRRRQVFPPEAGSHHKLEFVPQQEVKLFSDHVTKHLRRKRERKGSWGKHNWLWRSPSSMFGYRGGACQASHKSPSSRYPGTTSSLIFTNIHPMSNKPDVPNQSDKYTYV